MFDLITVGDAVSDLYIQPAEISLMCPAAKIKEKTCFEPVICLGYGEKIPIEDIHFDVGGSACNVAVGLSRQGFRTGFIGSIGKDSKGEEISAKLEKEGVSLRLIKKIKGIKTSFSIIFNYRGERTILVYRGLSDYSHLSLPKKLAAKWLFIGPLGKGYEKLYKEAISLAAERNIKLALNPGSLQIKDDSQIFKSLLRVTKILFLNKEEAEELSRLHKPAAPQNLLSEIREKGPEIIYITDGPEGAYAGVGEENLKISPYQAQRKEATGAGDAFSAGVLGALLSGQEPKEALQWGIINSSAVIEKIGAQTGLLTQAKIERQLSKAPIPRQF